MLDDDREYNLSEYCAHNLPVCGIQRASRLLVHHTEILNIDIMLNSVSLAVLNSGDNIKLHRFIISMEPSSISSWGWT